MLELMLKTSAAAILALLGGLIVRRSNPELAALLSLSAIAVILLPVLGMSAGFQELQKVLTDYFGLTLSSLTPLLKCVAASIVTKLTADLCRDHAQSAAASAVELAGSFTALGIVMPLVLSVLRLIGGLL